VGARLQRLFSTFANGWPGVGLLLLRMATAAVLLSCVAEHTSEYSLMSFTPLLVGAGAGVLLLVGFCTPVAGSVIVLVELWVALMRGENPHFLLLLVSLGAGLAMIGPGAWSIDAHLFGRKHIGISPR
jgi:putative oxidoreductase